MLQWRAITAVARLACPEALYGVTYTPDEAADAHEERTGGLAAALSAEQVDDDPDADYAAAVAAQDAQGEG